MYKDFFPSLKNFFRHIHQKFISNMKKLFCFEKHPPSTRNFIYHPYYSHKVWVRVNIFLWGRKEIFPARRYTIKIFPLAVGKYFLLFYCQKTGKKLRPFCDSIKSFYHFPKKHPAHIFQFVHFSRSAFAYRCCCLQYLALFIVYWNTVCIHKHKSTKLFILVNVPRISLC